MKRALVALVLLVASSTANAGLSFSELSTATRTEAFNVSGLSVLDVGTILKLGTLATDIAGTITFSYLGQESGYLNKFFLTVGPTQSLLESNPIGSSISAFVGSIGPISFGFEENFAENTGGYAVNGGNWDIRTSIGLVGTNMAVSSGGAAGTYDFVLGYNDSAGASTLGDWDDFVVGVRFAPVVSAVPEPEAYAMIGLGLAVLGWLGRRKKSKESIPA